MFLCLLYWQDFLLQIRPEFIKQEIRNKLPYSQLLGKDKNCCTYIHSTCECQDDLKKIENS